MTMETVSSRTQQGLDATPYFKGLLDSIRADKDSIHEVIGQLGYIDGKDAAVKEKLERAFYSAIMLQRNAIESRDEQEMEFADGTSLLAFHMGYHNEYLPAHEYPKDIKTQNYISGAELKKLQVQNMRATLQSIIDDPTKAYDIHAEAELRMAAVDRYVEAAHFTDVDDKVSDSDEHDAKIGNTFKTKLGPFVAKAVAAVALSATALITSANGSYAVEKNPIDDETYDSDDPARKQVRKLARPIALAPPPDDNFQPPVRLEGTPTPAVKPDGSIKIAAPADNNFKPPVIVEASPGPNIIPIPTVPNKPPAAPTPAIERAPIPEFIIDSGLAGETQWTAGQLEQVRANFGVYHEVQKETGVPWEVMAALHMREFSLQRVNPANGQGIYQLYSTGIYFAPGPVSDEEFKQQTILAAKFLLGKAGDNSRVGGPMDYSNPDKIKDALFAYNGLASQYFQQAARLGFNLGAEGSPYVMNMADDRRNSDLNSGWGQILVDNGPLGKANKAPGAWPLIEGLRKINQISHDQITAQRAAEDAAAAEAARAAAEAQHNAQKVAQQPELQKKPSANWVFPIAGGHINSHYGPRGEAFHDGIDSPADIGTDFLAIEDGIVIEHGLVDVTGQLWCKKALEGVGYYGPLPDPVQKTVFIKHLIGEDVYISRYDHLSEFGPEIGTIVKAGQSIGKVGSSGCSTGGHAHIGVKKNGKSINPEELFHKH